MWDRRVVEAIARRPGEDKPFTIGPAVCLPVRHPLQDRRIHGLSREAHQT
jgi:hypothetical protein